MCSPHRIEGVERAVGNNVRVGGRVSGVDNQVEVERAGLQCVDSRLVP